MSRVRRIDEFFEKGLIGEYDSLIRYEIGQEYEEVDEDTLRFRRMFGHPFMPFNHREDEALKCLDHIKIYVPLDAKHRFEGINLLEEFLVKNDIMNLSKTIDKPRFDNTVIRVCTKEDANKVLEFIKDNEYIQEGLMKPNPFTIQKDNVALACDGSFTYNGMLSVLLLMYDKDYRDMKTSGEKSCHNFNNWLKKEYVKIFQTTEDLEKFCKKCENSWKENHFNVDDIANASQVFELIIKATDENSNIDDLYEHFDRCCDVNDIKIRRKLVSETDLDFISDFFRDKEIYENKLSKMRFPGDYNSYKYYIRVCQLIRDKDIQNRIIETIGTNVTPEQNNYFKTIYEGYYKLRKIFNRYFNIEFLITENNTLGLKIAINLSSDKNRYLSKTEFNEIINYVSENREIDVNEVLQFLGLEKNYDGYKISENRIKRSLNSSENITSAVMPNGQVQSGIESNINQSYSK